MGDVFVRLNQKTVAGYWLAIWGTPGIDIEQQISQIVLDSWFDSGADLLPVGQTHTFGVQTVPLVAVASPNLIDGICAGICSLLLFISSSRLTHQCFMLYASCHSFLLLTPLPLLPSTPKRLTIPRGGNPPWDRCGFAANQDKVRCWMEKKKNSRRRISMSIFWCCSPEAFRPGS